MCFKLTFYEGTLRINTLAHPAWNSVLNKEYSSTWRAGRELIFPFIPAFQRAVVLLPGFWHTEYPINRKAWAQFIKYHLINFIFCSRKWKWTLSEKNQPFSSWSHHIQKEISLLFLGSKEKKDDTEYTPTLPSLATPQGLLATSLMFSVLPWPITCFTCIYSSCTLFKESQLPNRSNAKVGMTNAIPYSSHSLLECYRKSITSRLYHKYEVGYCVTFLSYVPHF